MVGKYIMGWSWRPPRVRHEPPTLDEAIAAAQGVTADPHHQIEIAASLMGISVEIVRLKTPPPSRLPIGSIAQPSRRLGGNTAGGRGAVIVERKVRRGVKAN
jgi:hypothetical protein